MSLTAAKIITRLRCFRLTSQAKEGIPRLWYRGAARALWGGARRPALLELEFEGELDGPGAADLVERVETAIGAAGAECVR